MACAALLACHLFWEGPRWHLGPAYLASLLAVGVVWWPRAFGAGFWTTGFCIALLAVSATVAVAFPVFSMPEPTGEHGVGTTVLHLVDHDRKDPRTDRRDGLREVLVQLWYPAEPGGSPTTYRTPAETTLKTQHLARVPTHAKRDAPVARRPTRHPILIFSPSTGGRRNHNTTQFEELASHGFVVAAMDHPYDTDLVAFPDGRVVKTGPQDAVDDDAKGEADLRTRVADARFVLDELERLDRDRSCSLAGAFDLSKIGVYGHSFGGALAAELCLTDPRVAAGVNLDGSVFGEAVRRGFGKPFLFFAEDVHIPSDEEVAKAEGEAKKRMAYLADDYRKIRFALAVQGGQWITIRGAMHVNFCDSPMYSPLYRWLKGGTIRQERATQTVNAYLLSFFRRHLKGEEDGLLDGTPPFPEVVVERIAAAGR